MVWEGVGAEAAVVDAVGVQRMAVVVGGRAEGLEMGSRVRM